MSLALHEFSFFCLSCRTHMTLSLIWTLRGCATVLKCRCVALLLTCITAWQSCCVIRCRGPSRAMPPTACQRATSHKRLRPQCKTVFTQRGNGLYSSLPLIQHCFIQIPMDSLSLNRHVGFGSVGQQSSFSSTDYDYVRLMDASSGVVAYPQVKRLLNE